MESLQQILDNYGPTEDPELLALKRYVAEHFHTAITVALHGNVIIATVPSAALAATLRLQSTKLRSECKLEKRVIFRIG